MARPLLTPEHAARIVDTLSIRHGRKLDDERFTVGARLEDETVVVTLTLERLDRTFLYRMESAMTPTEDESVSAADALDLCLDFLDWYLGEYFKDGREILLPLDFQPHRFGEFEVLARGDVLNPLLEDAADAWLRGERVEVQIPRRQRS